MAGAVEKALHPVSAVTKTAAQALFTATKEKGQPRLPFFFSGSEQCLCGCLCDSTDRVESFFYSPRHGQKRLLQRSVIVEVVLVIVP